MERWAAQRHAGIRHCSTRVVAAACALIAACALNDAWAQRPEGTYRQADVRGLEVLGPGCERVWLETRVYQLRALDQDNLVGMYGNIVISIPVGQGVEKNCVYSLPASTPVSTQLRNWNLGGKRISGTRWRIEATPSPSPAEAGAGLPTSPFRTEVDLVGEFVIDRAPDLGPQGMRFARARPLPDDLSAGLDETLRDVNSGECARVISLTAPADVPDRARLIGEICDLRRRISEGLGDYQSVRIVDATILDGYRVPRRQYQVRESYFVEFEAQFAQGTVIPGHALMERESDGGFAPVLLW